MCSFLQLSSSPQQGTYRAHNGTHRAPIGRHERPLYSTPNVGLNKEPIRHRNETHRAFIWRGICLGWACNMHGMLYCWALQRSQDIHKICLGWACNMHGLLYCWTLQRSQDDHKYAWAGPVVCGHLSPGDELSCSHCCRLLRQHVCVLGRHTHMCVES